MDVEVVYEDLGHFGKYQIINYGLLFFPVIFTAFYAIGYVFTAGDLEYRCLIPECETAKTTAFLPKWLDNAVPFASLNVPENCARFILNSSATNVTCSQDAFLKNYTESCNGTWLFKDVDNTIVSDFHLLCNENKWKRTIVGTVNNIGQFIGLPIAGMSSDRFGRKAMLVTACTMSAMCGIFKSLSTTYEMFLTFEFFDALVGSGIYSASFILGLELVGPKKRVIGGAIISSFFSTGEATLGLAMWWFKDWRTTLRVLYTPGLLILLYIWLLPESFRWLMAKGHYVEARKTIKKMAIVNNRPLSDDVNKKLDMVAEIKNKKKCDGKKYLSEPKSARLIEALKSKRIALRFVNCCFCWMTNTFVFYGLSLNSVAVAGNKYFNFIVVSLVEIPAFFTASFCMDKIGRRTSLWLGLLISGSACIAFVFVDKDMMLTRLLLYMMGKFSITFSFNVLYVFTAEMFPTELRHSLLGLCSMFGRIGSMTAPQTPLLAVYVEPLLLFSGCSLLAGSLALLFPETLNTPLPDTMKEAEDIGSSR